MKTKFHIESKTDAIDYNHIGQQGPFVKISNGNFRGVLIVDCADQSEISEIETMLEQDNSVVSFQN